MNAVSAALGLLWLATVGRCASRDFDSSTCTLPQGLVEEIASYEGTVRRIIDYVSKGDFKGKTYDELSKFVDKFGARISGSDVLENAIDYMVNLTREEGIDDVVTEPLDVPHWIRGDESLKMLSPRKKRMTILGLGTSVSTPQQGITAEIVVVTTFEELEKLNNDTVRGKIVVFAEPYEGYGETVGFRTSGASKAAKKGAVAALVRSITPFSINSPHTGNQRYEDGVTQIPVAAIAVEDADMLQRMFNRGDHIILKLKMKSTLEQKQSRNTLVDLKGTQNPEKLVIVSGHIDSWDVGQGAMDDGGGLLISWAAPVILKRLGLVPKRTVRAIFWTAEEVGLVGAYAYHERHKNELDNINFIMESDEGTFSPLGLAVEANQTACCIISEILKLFETMGASTLKLEDNPGSDITVITSEGIPGASLLNKNEKYFWFHHTEGDTLNVENPEELDMGAAFWTAVAYIIADISSDIPR